ncbi:PAS-domain containing protein [Lichenihabitans sp. Uapishka_5]|uniref:PAS-domain containing protein n=1 Tax=Lichenihabitans sp. Uapishka_5 TaxID=3037302 RepID=UPI0029E7CCFC|nr:PAS-domain containing protein [Lichenihabitans sp. Uapishka_5]MDX7950862.1 PAS-domain containing protein [Lichenihabitans sp. Uapishka_5]
MFRALIETMRAHLGLSLAGITMMAGDRLWMRTQAGLISMPKPEHSCFFDQVVAADGPLVVEDAATDPRFKANPYVARDCGIRFFVGLALRTSSGAVVGALCGAAKQPMPAPGAEQLASLKLLAEASICAIEVADHLEAIGEQSALLQITLDGIREGVSAFDGNMKLITWNARMSQLMQLPPDFLRKGLPFETYALVLAQKGAYGKGDPATIARNREADLRNARPHTKEFAFPDGQIVELRITPMPMGGFVATHTDVTKERHKAASLRAAAKRFELESTIAAIANEGSELEAALANALDAICGILGFQDGRAYREQGSEAVLQDTGIHYGDPDLAATRSPAQLLARRAQIVGGFVSTGFALEEAEPRHDERRGVAIPVPVIDTVYVLVCFGGAWDLRDLWFEQIATSLAHHLSRVAERERLQTFKDEFISTMNHEMRTPLTVINGGLELLQAGIYGPLSPEIAAAIGMMAANGRRLGNLVNDILDLDAIENASIPIAFDLIAVGGPAADALAVLDETARAQQVAIALTGSHDLIACTDAARLGQVIRHLLSNAIKFSPPGSRVVVEARSFQDGIRISVADQGSGIPESFRPKMFDKFTQADASDRRKVNGTGLGLTIVKQLVGRLRGRLSFESTLGSGTTFHVDLPRSAA